jgi:hypothetical protein
VAPGHGDLPEVLPPKPAGPGCDPPATRTPAARASATRRPPPARHRSHTRRPHTRARHPHASRPHAPRTPTSRTPGARTPAARTPAAPAHPPRARRAPARQPPARQPPAPGHPSPRAEVEAERGQTAPINSLGFHFQRHPDRPAAGGLSGSTAAPADRPATSTGHPLRPPTPKVEAERGQRHRLTFLSFHIQKRPAPPVLAGSPRAASASADRSTSRRRPATRPVPCRAGAGVHRPVGQPAPRRDGHRRPRTRRHRNARRAASRRRPSWPRRRGGRAPCQRQCADHAAGGAHGLRPRWSSSGGCGGWPGGELESPQSRRVPRSRAAAIFGHRRATIHLRM